MFISFSKATKAPSERIQRNKKMKMHFENWLGERKEDQKKSRFKTRKIENYRREKERLERMSPSTPPYISFTCLPLKSIYDTRTDTDKTHRCPVGLVKEFKQLL